MKYTVLVASALSSLPAAMAWGEEGHATIAYIAQGLISSETVTQTQSILGDSSSDWLASIASWADDYRYTSAGAWSEPLHFIDAMDSPPSDCNVNYDRDCGERGCSISALVNYTQRVTDSSLSSADITEALKFIVHFVGDVHQPLHDENLEVGGNDIDCTFNGDSTELHAVWDTAMIEQDAGSQTLSNANTFANTLLQEIQSGSYSSEASSWSQGMDINNVQSTAMVWASDANSYVCSVVMPNGPDVFSDGDLYPDYYNSAIPTVELLLSRAGYRLAAWLNLIFTGSTGGL